MPQSTTGYVPTSVSEDHAFLEAREDLPKRADLKKKIQTDPILGDDHIKLVEIFYGLAKIMGMDAVRVSKAEALYPSLKNIDLKKIHENIDYLANNSTKKDILWPFCCRAGCAADHKHDWCICR